MTNAVIITFVKLFFPFALFLWNRQQCQLIACCVALFNVQNTYEQ